MQSDLPHTLCKNNKKDGGNASGKAQGRVRADDPAFAMQREAYEKKLAKMRAKTEGEQPFTMDELFG